MIINEKFREYDPYDLMMAAHQMWVDETIEKLKRSGGSVEFTQNQPLMICDTLDEICDIFIDKIELSENDKLVITGHELYGEEYTFNEEDFAYCQFKNIVDFI